MYDHLGTKKIYTMPKVGTIVRNDGYGSRLMRVTEVIKDQVLLESYGLLDYGDIRYPTRSIQKTTGKIYPVMRGNGYMIVTGGRPSQSYSYASYTPVELVSRMKPHQTGYHNSAYYQDLRAQAWEQATESANR